MINYDEKAYVLYANEAYIPTVKACVASIRQYSELPIYVYLLNAYEPILGAKVISWTCDVPEVSINKYIDRSDSDVYRLLIERPMVVKNALAYHAKTVAYIDCDSIATKYIDTIFDLYPEVHYPYFVEGIYDYLHIDGRGGADTRDDMSTTLEAPACELFGVNQYIRQKYRQTGYFVAGQNCVDFLDEWYWMCNHPKVLANHNLYAPYHEETLANVLLWKLEVLDGLPYIYTNASLDRIDSIFNSLEWGGHHETWFKLPENKESLLFLHGEKDPEVMYQMIDALKEIKSKPRVMYIAPHLSTGGMPAFLLKTIQELKDELIIYVVEYQCHSLDYVVQRNAIMEIVGNNFTTLYEDKMELFKVIDQFKPQIIHLHDPAERFNQDVMKQLYRWDRPYKIVETFHDVAFKPKEKLFSAEAYAFCTPHHLKTFPDLDGYKQVIEFPIENKQPGLIAKMDAKEKLGFNKFRANVLNVGLWTKGKNQGEGLEIARKYPDVDFHFVGNQAGNFADYWEPLMKDIPDNVRIWGERNDVDEFMIAADIFMFNSTWECNPLVLREAIGYGLPVIARNLPQYEDMFTKYLLPIDTNLDLIDYSRYHNIKVYDLPENTFAQDYIEFYNNVTTLHTIMNKITIDQHFVDGPFLEIKGISDSKFRVAFFDERDRCHYDNTIGSNCWVRLNRQYYTKWTARVWQDSILVYESTLDFTDKSVFIVIDSKSLGDTIAWIDYALEFQKKHHCKVIVSSFWNKILDYPELELVEPGATVPCYALYRIGWYWNEAKEPELCNTIPLQKTMTNILGLEYAERRPKIKYGQRPITPTDFPYVAIATNSTMECKFWTREGWQEVIDWLNDLGYSVINVSKEDNPFANCIKIADTSIENTMDVIAGAKLFIGLSSGLSWLAWALHQKVVMISNFTEAGHEFDCYRVTKPDVCNSCWNDPTIKLDPHWNWCPRNKDFECQRSIPASMVIEEIKKASFN